jgi:hypothetical protein
MEKYREVRTTAHRPAANKMSAVLENAGIPLMVQHVEISSGQDLETRFRLLVPDQHSQKALLLVNAADSDSSVHM